LEFDLDKPHPHFEVERGEGGFHIGWDKPWFEVDRDSLKAEIEDEKPRGEAERV